jgi:hypothetical protein
MKFFVLQNEKSKKYYDFFLHEFVEKEQINERCLLPTLAVALKIKKYEFMFVTNPNKENLLIKPVKFDNDSFVEMQKQIEVKG